MIGPPDQYPPAFWNALGAFDFDRANGLVDDLEALYSEAGRPLLPGLHPLEVLRVAHESSDAPSREHQHAYDRRWARICDSLCELIDPLIHPQHDSVHRDASGDRIYRSGGHGARRRDVRPLVKRLVRERAEGRCELCGRGERDTLRFVCDHLFPVVHGGPRACWNLGWLCDECDQRKWLSLHPRALRLAFGRLRWMYDMFYRPVADQPDPGRSARHAAENWLAIESLRRNL